MRRIILGALALAVVAFAVLVVVDSDAAVALQSSQARSYTVVAGDTATALARRNAVTIGELLAANPALAHRRGTLLRVGETVRIPVIDRSAVLPGTLRANPDRLALRPIIHKWAKRNGIPADLVEATLYLESGWNQQRISSTGAVGIGQLMPGTAAFIKTDLIGARAGGLALDPAKPEDNIRMSARYLRFLLAMHGGDSTKALHAYYQGVGSISLRGLYDDTRAYAAAIQALRQRFRADPTGLG